MSPSNNKLNIDWNTIDWLQQDIVISRSLGCSREAVRQARLRLHAGKPLNPKKHTKDSSIIRLMAIDTSNMVLPELAKIAKCHEGRVLSVLKELGKDFKRRKRGGSTYDWSKFPKDWRDKTDKEIAVLLGVKHPSLVAQWRFRHGYRKRAKQKVFVVNQKNKEAL